MTLTPGVYWYRGPLFCGRQKPDRTGWEVVEIDDIGGGELVLGLIGDPIFHFSAAIAKMVRLGEFIPIAGPDGLPRAPWP